MSEVLQVCWWGYSPTSVDTISTFDEYPYTGKGGPRRFREKNLQDLDPAITQAFVLSSRRILRQICICHSICHMWTYQVERLPSYRDMKVYQISAITIKVKDKEKSCSLYSKIPGFRLTYGGEPSDSLTTFEIGEGSKTTYLNLERIEDDERSSDFSKKSDVGKTRGSEDFGKVIFHTEKVDKLYSYMKQDEYISKYIVFENKPINAPWGERFFHIREPNGYQLSFAKPL
jgi:catechol 2,3-dioxygenase-like lactoylglutathione lyase family enzyme